MGVLRVDCQLLKAALLPTPLGLLNELAIMVPHMAARMHSEYVSRVHEAHMRLTSPCSVVEEYVEKLTFLEEIKVGPILITWCCQVIR